MNEQQQRQVDEIFGGQHNTYCDSPTVTIAICAEQVDFLAELLQDRAAILDAVEDPTSELCAYFVRSMAADLLTQVVLQLEPLGDIGALAPLRLV